MALSKIDEAGWGGTQLGGRRNLIINGAMQVAQRGTSQSIAASTTPFPVDRMEVGFGAHTELAGTVSQSTIAPSGFSNSVKVDVTTAETALDSGEGVTFRQKFEGQNLQQIAKGTADAKQVTLSFWVRSSQTGTYVAELYDNDNARQISKSYTIDTANTWEYKTITFPADTTGAFDNDNNLSLFALWWLCAGSTYSSGTLNDDAWASVTNADRAAGQTNLIGSVNDWYITGVQLEVGSVATPFEHRSYDEELTLCHRYFVRGDFHTSGISNFSGAVHYFFIPVQFPVPLRASPAATNNSTIKLYSWSSETAIASGNINSYTHNRSGVTTEPVYSTKVTFNATSANAPAPVNGPGTGNVHPMSILDGSFDAEL